MPLVNHTLDNIVQGVSQQYQEGRYETQVEEMINCIPSLNRGVLRRNPVVYHSALEELLINPSEDVFTYTYDKGVENEQYLVVIPGDGNWMIYRLPSDTVNIKQWKGFDPYLEVQDSNITARQAFKAITLGDLTFVTNSTIKVQASTTLNTLPKENYENWAFYWIKLTTQVVTAQRTENTESGSRLEGFVYTLTDSGIERSVAAVKDTRPGETDPDVITADRIAETFAAMDVDWFNSGSYVYDLKTKVSWIGEDTNGNTASLAVWKTVTHASELPINLPKNLDGFIVRVVGMADVQEDDYYLQFKYYDNTWIEVAEPGASIGVDPATMPHCFYAIETAGERDFMFDEYVEVDENNITGDSKWQQREVGDLLTNPDPKFVDNNISNLFFFKNRLGFISNDTITMSRVGDYGGVYLDTIQVVKDDGPINLFVATTDVNVLRHAVPTASTLIIMADEAQFILHSGDQPLTPITATINVLSRYDYSPLVDAQSYGNSLIFTSTAGGYTQILEMSLKDAITSQVLQAEADILTNHIPSYIPSDVQLMAIHNVLGYTFFHTNKESNALSILTHKSISQKRVQLAFHKWTFDFDIMGVHVVNNYLYIITTDGTLATIPLEIPGDIDNYTYSDKTLLGDYSEYTSGVWFSNFYFRDNRGLGSNRGRYQLRTMLYDVLGEYITTIISTREYYGIDIWACYSPLWNDNLTWVDNNIWVDSIPTYSRTYVNDKLITIMEDNENAKIIFANNDSKGFELHTVNIEALFHQRSRRT